MDDGESWGTPPEDGSSQEGVYGGGDGRSRRAESGGDRRNLFPAASSSSGRNNGDQSQGGGHSYSNDDFHSEYVPDGRGLSIGLRMYYQTDVATSLRNARRAGFSFVVLDNVLDEEYVNSKLRGVPFPEDRPLGWFDMDLKSPADWTNNIVLKIRTLDQEIEGSDATVAFRAQEIIQREFKYAKHLGVSVFLCELPKSMCFRLAQVLNSQLYVGFTCSVWVKIPIYFENEGNDSLQDVGCMNKTSAWGMWDQFRSLCSNHSKLYPVLEIPADLPEDHIINRWFGEPVKAIFLSTKIFMANSKGYPVLSHQHQQVVLKFMDLGAQVIINGDLSQNSTPKEHVWFREYINYIRDKVALNWDNYSSDMRNYEDFLQIPLQPLHDDLESQTYDCFEKDPVKYELYREAVAQALTDLIPTAEINKKRAIVMVVGAGRGPLVRKTLEAANSVKRNVKVYAVEKNFGAINTLRVLRQQEWRNYDVNIVEDDMREWNAPEKADIIISELLGSFGDNELSPECLDGAQKFLKPGGIMIPKSYTSYICPVMSSKIWQSVRKSAIRMDLGVVSTCVVQFETPYVCNLRTRYEIAKPMKVFHFEHPRPDPKASNDRMTDLKFTAPQNCTVHGLLGFFESVLYGSVIMSILPQTFTRGMFSWFPIFFPIRNPMPMVTGEDGIISIWRLSSPSDVWYEWSVCTSHGASHIHNANGKSYKINLR